MHETSEVRLRVLVVDDEPTAREVLRLGVERLGCETAVAEDAATAIALLSQERFHVVITDKNMPGTEHRTEGGLDVIRAAKRFNPDCAVLMVTGFASLESAIEAMRLGAFDYITKPVRVEELKAKIDRVVAYQQTIDPAGAFTAYTMFRDKFLGILEQEEVCQFVAEEVKARVVAAVQQQIDRIFHERREWERIIFEQSEALGRIAAWAEELQEHLAGEGEGRVGELLARISSEANHRV